MDKLNVMTQEEQHIISENMIVICECKDQTKYARPIAFRLPLCDRALNILTKYEMPYKTDMKR